MLLSPFHRRDSERLRGPGLGRESWAVVLGALPLDQASAPAGCALGSIKNSASHSRAGTDPRGPLNCEEPVAREMGLA